MRFLVTIYPETGKTDEGSSLKEISDVKLNCVTQPDTVYSSESTKPRLAVEINNQLRFTIFTENSYRLGEHLERCV